MFTANVRKSNNGIGGRTTVALGDALLTGVNILKISRGRLLTVDRGFYKYGKTRNWYEHCVIV